MSICLNWGVVANCGLIADGLKASGVEVIHILDQRHDEQHPYTQAARIVDGLISYATTPNNSFSTSERVRWIPANIAQ